MKYFSLAVLHLLVFLIIQPLFVLRVEAQNDVRNVNTSNFKEYSLNNGLKIILMQDKAFPLVSCFSWYKVGSRNDPAGMSGLTHLVEHLLFQNIGSFKSNQWGSAIIRSGGEFGGFTSEDFTTFYSNLPSYQLELGLRGEAARMRGAHFSKPDLAKEIELLSKEEKSEDQDPMRVLNREVHAAAYEKHPYRNPPGGWRHELEKLTIEAAKAQYDSFFQPNNAYLILVGNFDEENATRLIEKYFGNIPKAQTIGPDIKVAEMPRSEEKLVTLKSHADKESLIIAYRVPGIGDTNAPVVSILEQYLNQSFNGPLRGQLMDSGLCSSVQVSFEQKRDPSLFLIKCAGLKPNAFDRVLRIIESSISKITADELSAEEVNRLVKQSLFSYYLEGDGPYRRGFQSGFFATLADTDYLNSWPDSIKRVNGEGLLRVARQYLTQNNRILGQSIIEKEEPVSQEKKSDLNSNGAAKQPGIEKTSMNASLSDTHFRLAAYEPSQLKPYAVLAQHLMQGAPLGPMKVAKAKTQKNASARTTQAVKSPPPVQPANQVSKTQNTQQVIPSSQFKILRNGLRILVLESHLSPLVQIYGAVKAGSAYEQADEKGMSDLLAGIFNQGNIRSDEQQLADLQTDAGMPLNAMLKFVSKPDNIILKTNCLTSDISAQLSQVFACLIDPRIQANDIESAKSAVIANLKNREKLRDNKINRLLLQGLIAQNSSYYPAYPDDKINTITASKEKDILDFYHEHVTPGNTTLVIVGDVSAKSVFDMCEQLTEGWILDTKLYSSATNSIKAPQLVLSDKQGYKSSLIGSTANPAEITFGRIIPVTETKDLVNFYAALAIVNCVLCDHPILSHLTEQLNSQSGLSDIEFTNCFDADISKLENKLIWSLNIHLPAKPSSSNVINAIQSLLKQFNKTGLRQDEVIEAKKYLIGSIPVRQCSNLDELAGYTFQGITELNERAPIIKVQKAIYTMKYEELNDFIAKVFKPERTAIVVAGPRELIRQVRPIQVAGSNQVNSD